METDVSGKHEYGFFHERNKRNEKRGNLSKGFAAKWREKKQGRILQMKQNEIKKKNKQ